MNVTHESKYYRQKADTPSKRRNGAFFYSVEICERLIPAVKTDRPWITVNSPQDGAEDRAIVFVHNNLHPERYEWLKRYKDLILVCGVPETCEKVAHLGTAIYLPISIDVEDVKRHEGKKTRKVAFVGRESKKMGFQFPQGTDFLVGIPREKMLDELARYEQVYAVGRSAIEAAALGCEILPYDPRFPNPARWQVVDTLEAAKVLQASLDDIDGVKREPKKAPAKKKAPSKKKAAPKKDTESEGATK